MRPQVSMVRRTSAATDASSVTEPEMAMASPPSDVISPATVSATACARSLTTTLAPCPAR